MSEKTKNIIINDFELFYEAVKSVSKIANSAKFNVNSLGLEVYSAHERYGRSELQTNAICSQEDITFSILDLSMLLKVLGTAKEVQGDDFSDFKFYVDSNSLKFQSKKFKTKFVTTTEDTISRFISTKITTPMTSVFEFKTNSDILKRIIGHQFMFSSAADLRVYVETRDDMEKNVVYATLGNHENDLNNEIMLKMGLVTSGTLSIDRKIILDVDRLNLFNASPTAEMTISLMNMNCLVSKSKACGKNNSYLSLNIYTSILKN